MVTIEVNRLRLRAFHGVNGQERIVGNDFEVSISVDYPPAAEAVENDNVESTLDYAELITIAREEMAVPSALIEHVAGRIRDAVMRRFPGVTGGRVRVSKLRPPVAGVELGETAVVIVW